MALICIYNLFFISNVHRRSVGPNRIASYQAQIQQFGAILSATVKELGRAVSVKLPSHFILWAIGFVRCVLLCRSKVSNIYADSYLSIFVYCLGHSGDWKYICRFNFFQIPCSRLIQYFLLVIAQWIINNNLSLYDVPSICFGLNMASIREIFLFNIWICHNFNPCVRPPWC
jgi:hypothetical protein